MNFLKLSLLITFFTYSIFTFTTAQQTYHGAVNKHSLLTETKLLKTGKLVFLERVNYCSKAHVKLISENGYEESIFTAGFPKYYAFNELPDNNWVLVLITDPADDVPIPYNIHIITFIEDEYAITSKSDNQTDIDLQDITESAVINSSELVLAGASTVNFTDFELSTVISSQLPKELEFMKSPVPTGPDIYYKYSVEDAIKSTDDRFVTDFTIAFNLGTSFRDFHYLGNYAIFQDEQEISATAGIFSFEYIEQNKTIYDFRQHGQNLRYYTLSSDSILTFNKLFLDELGILQKDNFDIDLKSTRTPFKLYWDGDFKGYSFNFFPLSPDEYVDDYTGYNYNLNYNMEGYDLETQNLDISIDDVEYTIANIDTTTTSSTLIQYYADINMDITITNNTDKPINDLHLHSRAFEGINCAYNRLKVDDDIISIEPNGTTTVTARYESLEYSNQYYLTNTLCVYAIGANNEFDDKFDDNIFCLDIMELTSTNDQLDMDEFSIAPNPAHDRIQLESENPSSEYYVYSMDGRLVANWKKSLKREYFDISSFEIGTYIVVDKKSNSRILFSKI